MKLKRDKIVFNDKKYPVVELTENNKTIRLSIDELQDDLFDENDDYISPSAENIDNSIMYFLEPDEIHLNKKNLLKVLYYNGVLKYEYKN